MSRIWQVDGFDHQLARRLGRPRDGLEAAAAAPDCPPGQRRDDAPGDDDRLGDRDRADVEQHRADERRHHATPPDALHQRDARDQQAERQRQQRARRRTGSPPSATPTSRARRSAVSAARRARAAEWTDASPPRSRAQAIEPGGTAQDAGGGESLIKFEDPRAPALIGRWIHFHADHAADRPRRPSAAARSRRCRRRKCGRASGR